MFACVHAQLLQPCPTFCDPKTVFHQAPLSMRFSRQECWSGLLCPPPGDLPNPGTEPTSLRSPALAGGFFTIRATWNARMIFLTNRNKVPLTHTQMLKGSTAHQSWPHRLPCYNFSLQGLQSCLITRQQTGFSA